jgi:hypothetical protein
MKITQWQHSGIIALFGLFFALGLSQPSDAKEAPALLFARQSYDEELTGIKNNSEWTAIVASGKHSVVKKTKISIVPLKDYPDIDVKEVVSEAGTLFLLRGMELKEGAVIETYPVPDEESVILDGKHSVTIQGKKASIVVYGKRVNYKEEGMDKESSGYWQLAMKLRGKEILLTQPKFWDDGSASLIWAGDLNQDGYPDFLAGVSPKYSYNHYALFMSNAQEDSVTYKKFAEYQGVGC